MLKCSKCEHELTESDKLGSGYACPKCGGVTRLTGRRLSAVVHASRVCDICYASSDKTRKFRYWTATRVSRSLLPKYENFSEVVGAVCPRCLRRHAVRQLCLWAPMAIGCAMFWSWYPSHTDFLGQFLVELVIVLVLIAASLASVSFVIRYLLALLGVTANRVGAEILVKGRPKSGTTCTLATRSRLGLGR